ncbi:MAG: class I SAM-dependent methyltransferase [Patescibacteria group bacterium]
MKKWYARNVIPHLVQKDMGAEKLQECRREVIAEAAGIVLEIGVGPGYSLPLYSDIAKLYALEPSEKLLQIARAKSQEVGVRVEFLQASAEDIPLPDHAVDTVVSIWVLCSVKDPAKALHEVWRVLRPGGRFIFMEHGKSPRRFKHTAQKVYTWLTRHFTGNCHYDRDIHALIEQSGFMLAKAAYSHEKGEPLIYNYEGVAVVHKT